MTKNRHLVSRRQWKKWSELARAVFNETYELMCDQPLINSHPKSFNMPDEHWVTVAWNAAFLAAGAVEHANGRAPALLHGWQKRGTRRRA